MDLKKLTRVTEIPKRLSVRLRLAPDDALFVDGTGRFYVCCEPYQDAPQMRQIGTGGAFSLQRMESID